MLSQKTAEPMAQEDHARLLTKTHVKGFIKSYNGVRLSSPKNCFSLNIFIFNFIKLKAQMRIEIIYY